MAISNQPLWDRLDENLRQLDGFVRVVIQDGVHERQQQLRMLNNLIEHLRSVLEQHRDEMRKLMRQSVHHRRKKQKRARGKQ